MYRRAIRRKNRVMPATGAPQQAPARRARSPLASLMGVPSHAPLTIGAANDPAEQQADAAADHVMRVATPTRGEALAPVVRREASGGSATGSAPATPAAQSAIASLGSGAPLPASERAFFEPRFGADLSGVRVHDGAAADTASQSIQARAFTLGSDVAFARGEYRPGTGDGRRLMAHELAHVLQGGGEARRVVRRVTADQCASDCTMEDGIATKTGKYTLTIMADKEGPFLLIPFTSNVGHAWLRLQDDTGNYWTYGFWPQTGFDASQPFADVEGCVHHPDTAHDDHITASQSYELTAAQFAAAKSYASGICAAKPKYNLFQFNCTEFVRKTLDAAGQGSWGGFGLIWESPNGLDAWMRLHALEIGTSATAATTAPKAAGAGSFGFELSYRHQFYSMLGHKLRLYGVGQTELGGPIKIAGAGVGVSLDPQRVWLPSLYAEGMGTFGDMNPGADKFGAGLSAGYGLNYRIDALGSIGVEHNFLKDFVNDDPALGRLMIKAKINLW